MNHPHDSSRRQFLKHAALISAAPLILPNTVWGAGKAPGERITLAHIGMGTQNRGLLSGFLRKEGTQVVAVCDVDTTRRENARKIVNEFYTKKNGAPFTGCDVYSDFREVLARKDIDAVVIATPDHWHAMICIAAAKAGKDIYCEKPLCESIHEARAVVKAVRKHNRIFQVGSMQRSMREFRAACELVRNGVIGKIQRIEVGVGGPPIPCDLPTESMEPGLDWNMWLGPAMERGYHSELSPRGVHTHFPNWRRYREYGGGMVTDWGAHHFDIAQWGMNMDQSGPSEIFPADKPNAQEGVRFVYANGTEVIHKAFNGVWFHGTEGRIQVNRGKFEFWKGDTQKAESPAQCEQLLKDLLPPTAEHLYRSTDHQADFLSCIRSRKKPICDVEVGARTVTVCHLVNLAYIHGQRLKWDPTSEKFTGGTGNPKWLDREYRGPWKLG